MAIWCKSGFLVALKSRNLYTVVIQLSKPFPNVFQLVWLVICPINPNSLITIVYHVVKAVTPVI